MSRAKSLCTALFAVLLTTTALTSTTAFAFALPDVHVLAGEGYPATGTGEVTGTAVGQLETELGEKLTSSAVKVSLELVELSSLGPLTLTFTGVVEPKTKTSCNTTGSAAGTVSVPGEYHVVDTSTSPLTAALLVLFKELAIECNSGKLKVKVRSPTLVKLEKVTSGADTTKYGLVAKCTGKGKQELKTYFNDEGVSTKGTLTANFGLGFEASCENVAEELVVTSSKMIAFEGTGPDVTTLSTALSGESKEGEELTVLEGSTVKDKATLSGKSASKATGKVAYKVYSDKECKTLVTSAGEVTVSGESVPASSEVELEGGKTYYWQAHYGGDTNNAESTSPCSEVLSVKAKTTLSLALSGGGSEGEELAIFYGEAAQGKATLSGTNSSSAGGEAVYDVYSDSGCKTFVTAAGEVSVSSGKVPASSEQELEGNETYYWQATYKGDALHQESKSTCGKTVLKVQPKCTTKPYCEPTITPGVEIKVQQPDLVAGCTAGPIMKDGTDLFLLTAGHCFAADDGPTTEEVQSKYPNVGPAKDEIGENGTRAKNAEYDLGEVKIENGEWLSKGTAPALLVEWGVATKVKKITGQVVSAAGDKTCFSGAKTGLHCGEVLQTATSDPEGTANLVETTAAGDEGDSGAPEYAPGKDALIQGIYVAHLENGLTKAAKGQLTTGVAEVTGWNLEPKAACAGVNKMKEKWGVRVPIEGEGIPPKTTVTECKEAGATATLKMSANATETKEVEVTVGQKELGFYEPMSEIDTKYPTQKLVTK